MISRRPVEIKATGILRPNQQGWWTTIFRFCLTASIWASCLVPLFLCLISMLGRYWYWAELAINFRLQIALLMVVGWVCLLLTRKYWLSLAYLLLTVWASWTVLSIYLPATQPSPGARQFSVMAFNLFNLNSSPELDLQTIDDSDADLLVLTEYTNRWFKAMQPLRLKYPYSIEQPRWHGYGIALFSKFPILEEQVIGLSESIDVPMLLATVDVNGQPVRILGIHTVSPVGRIRMKIRNEQLQIIAGHVPEPDQACILVGDLNCVPWSSFMHPFWNSGLRDSRQGFGFHPTWHRSFGPFKIPIDHCLVSQAIHVHQRSVGRSFGSDHFPILLKLSIEQEQDSD